MSSSQYFVIVKKHVLLVKYCFVIVKTRRVLFFRSPFVLSIQFVIFRNREKACITRGSVLVGLESQRHVCPVVEFIIFRNSKETYIARKIIFRNGEDTAQ